jgi:hypothetical protein
VPAIVRGQCAIEHTVTQDAARCRKASAYMPWKKPVAMGSAHIIANIKVVNLLLQVERAMPT